jgi:hypothetical protein
MPDLARFWRRLSAVLALALLAAAGTAAAAQAEYGEIQRFGSAGTGEGQFETQEAGGFGVNPKNNDIYVVDLVNAENNTFRIQRFDPNSKGEYGKPVASITFKPKDESLKTTEEDDQISNVAVDPEKNRIYVLAAEERPVGLIDSGKDAASQLFAFNIENEALTSLGVIASTKVLKPLAEGEGEALLEPDGIAVDPTNHDVIILGEEERGHIEPVIALERLTEAGKLAEARWSDPTSSEESRGFLEDEASSPTVTKSGEVLVDSENEGGEIDKIPSSFSSEAKATLVYAANPEVEEQPAAIREELTDFWGTADMEPRGGGVLSLGEDGTLYARADITEQNPGAHGGKLTGPEAPGVLEFSTSKGLAVEGWTGGQSIKGVGPSGPCKISVNVDSQVAAGTAHHVFAFDENPESPSIIEFGPEGKGCAKGSVAPPTASTTFSGGAIPENEPIPIADKVTLSSKLVESNALSVEWEFGDGTSKTISTDEHQTTSVEHTFVRGGKLEVTEKIHTDDLAEPLLVTHSKITIKGNEPVVIAGATSNITTTSAKLNATVNPEGSEVTKCTFEYGTTTSYGTKEPCTPSTLAAGATAAPVSASISGLAQETTYDVRIVATNAGSETGEAKTTFKTAGKPVVVASATTALTQTSATLNATVNPEGSEVTKCTFEYGTSLPSGKTASCAPSPGTGKAAVAVSAAIAGLSANTTYDVKITATNTSGTGEATTTFKTAAESGGGGGSNTGGGGNTGGGSSPPPPPGGGVLPSITVSPTVTLSGGSASVTSAGALTLKLQCKTGATSCTGTIMLKTAKAVTASVGHSAKKKKPAILTLATGSFTMTGGQLKSLTLHLSSTARSLLAHMHVLGAIATIVARNAAAEKATTKASVSLRLKVAKKH